MWKNNYSYLGIAGVVPKESGLFCYDPELLSPMW